VRSINTKKLDNFIKEILREDCCLADVTTASLNYGNQQATAVIKAKEDGVCAGLNVVKQILLLADRRIKFKPLIKDGSAFKKDDVLARISGSVSSILSCESTILNFLSQLSGVATLTREFVNKVKPFKARIMDTRKTTPGLRLLEKYAVRMGGGYNHRYDLGESVLIKDNHIAMLKNKIKDLDLGLIIRNIKNKIKDKEIEVEVNNMKEFRQVIKCPPDIIMLDNMGASQIRKCVKLRNKLNKRIRLEVSGNVSLENVKKLAGLGIDRISIGRLTHSPKAIDMSLEFMR